MLYVCNQSRRKKCSLLNVCVELEKNKNIAMLNVICTQLELDYQLFIVHLLNLFNFHLWLPWKFNYKKCIENVLILFLISDYSITLQNCLSGIDVFVVIITKYQHRFWQDKGKILFVLLCILITINIVLFKILI